MEPASLTLGAIVAGLVAKASERATERAVDGGEGALRRLVARVRERFADDEDAAGSLALVQRAPDSAVLVRELAEQIARWVTDHPEFGSELERLVADAQSEGVKVHTFQTASGHRIVQIADAPGSEININYGSQGPPRPGS